MKIQKISMAVAAAIAMSQSAFALDPTATAAAEVQLTVSGASASRDAFGALMANTVCASGFSILRASPTTGQDFRAYSCTLASLEALGSAAGKTAVVYYRSEGGSAWGPVPVAFGTSIKRLEVTTAGCNGTSSTLSLPGVAAAVQQYTCAVSGYNIDTDAFGSGALVNDTTDLGVADEEPKMYGAPNFPTSTVFNGIPASARQPGLNAINGGARVAFGQTFGVSVNTSNAGSPFFGATVPPTLSKQAIAGIFNGTYTNWNQVPTATGAKVTTSNVAIKLCRREPGSGTQVAANQFFLGVPQCGATLGAFRTDGTDNDTILGGGLAGDTDGVIERGTSSDLNTCVANFAGGIGLTVANSLVPGTGTILVAIDGSVPTTRPREAAASGQYPFSYELTFQVASSATGDVAALANGLIDLSLAQATAPNVGSVVALPNDVNDPFSQTTFVSTTPPIGYATRGGNSCNALAPVAP